MSRRPYADLAHKIALNAHRELSEARDREKARIAALEARERTERVSRKWEAALAILNKWFPGVQWRVVDDGEGYYYSAFVLTPADADPDDPLKIRVEHTLADMNAPEAGFRTRLYLVKQRHQDGYTRWLGPEVKWRAEIGSHLAGENA